MSGHSKWSTIKRQKGANDAKRGQVFTKIAREITVAAKSGVPSPDANNRLRLAIQKARLVNMPNDNIERAIKRATASDGSAANFEEIYYEAYGPQGTALMVHALTDNRNRTIGELRAALTRGNGRLGESGSVAYLFDQLGVVRVRLDGRDADEISLLAIEAGASDVEVDDEDDVLEIRSAVGDLRTVQEMAEANALTIEAADVNMVPRTTVSLDETHAVQVLRLIERIEDLEDIQEVFSNLELSSDVMEKVAAGV
jgi:YebC/PmpR family DNA-binding regulatory protein